MTKVPIDDIRTNRTNLQRAFNHVFSGELGNMVLDDLKEFCGIGYDAYASGSFDRTAYSLGMQRVFLHIEARMTYDGNAPQMSVARGSDDE